MTSSEVKVNARSQASYLTYLSYLSLISALFMNFELHYMG